MSSGAREEAMLWFVSVGFGAFHKGAARLLGTLALEVSAWPRLREKEESVVFFLYFFISFRYCDVLSGRCLVDVIDRRRLL